jgi:N-acyl homoserine lactone hydrolase
VWGDGSIVLVPAPGHTPGSIVAFIALPTGKRYALIGDLTWQLEGVTAWPRVL